MHYHGIVMEEKKTNHPVMPLDKIIIWIRAICFCVRCVFRNFLLHIDLRQKADPVQEYASDHEEYCIIDFTTYRNTYLRLYLLLHFPEKKLDYFHKAFHAKHIEPY